MSGKFTTVRFTLDGERFEILVNPDPALSFKLGKDVGISQVLAVDQVYSDTSKGLRISSEKLRKFFQTDDLTQVAESILKRGELQLTTDQRRTMVQEKRKQVVSSISRDFIDPKTGLPHPAIRIEQALQDARVSIDPFKEIGEQTKTTVDIIRSILPLKSENVKLSIRVPPQYAPQAIGVIKGFSEIQKEEWGSDGTLIATMEIPAGIQPSVLDKLGSVTKGSAQASILR